MAFGINGPGKWNKPHLNQGPLCVKQTNQKGHLWLAEVRQCLEKNAGVLTFRSHGNPLCAMQEAVSSHLPYPENLICLVEAYLEPGFARKIPPVSPRVDILPQKARCCLWAAATHNHRCPFRGNRWLHQVNQGHRFFEQNNQKGHLYSQCSLRAPTSIPSDIRPPCPRSSRLPRSPPRRCRPTSRPASAGRPALGAETGTDSEPSAQIMLHPGKKQKHTFLSGI